MSRERVRVQIETGPGKTEQSHRKQCDINYILKDYAKTGIIKHAHANAGRYDDVSNIDYQTALNIVADTKSMFEGLPSLIRNEFGNDPGRFLEFVRDPANGPRMQELGITPGVDGIDAEGQLIGEVRALVEAITPGTERSPDKQSGSTSEAQNASGGNTDAPE